MQWNTGYTESVHTFANTINTHEGGTHEEGFRAALTSMVNNWGEEWGLIKKKEDRSPATTSARASPRSSRSSSAEPQFEGQTKTKLGNTEVKGFVQRVVNDQLGDWFEKNPAEGRDIVRKAMSAARPGSRPARPASSPAPARGCSAAAACPASWPTASPPNPERVRDLHRRG